MQTRETRTHFLIILIVVAALLAAAACGNKRSASRRGVAAVVLPPAATAAKRRTLAPLPVRPLSPRLEAVRAGAMAGASAARGLSWKGEVGMTELSGWEYGTRTKEVAEVLGGEDLKALSKLAVAGGMLPEGTDLATLAISFTAASAGATYSPLDKQVLLLQPEKPSTDATRDRSLLTHEFVHALQDQHFDLLNLLLARPYDFDRMEAAFALVEGDAMNVQRRQETDEKSWQRRTLDDIARQEDERFGEYRKGIGAFFPPLLTETFIFRYRDGARFVEAMRRSRPAVSVDELFRRPPASSEQVLHPEKYVAAEAPRAVNLDEAAFDALGWRAMASASLGEIGVRGLLMAGVSRQDATRAAAGWGGDRAFVFERAAGASSVAPSLFVWKTSWDRREDSEEFFRAYNALQRRRGAAEADHPLSVGGDASTVWREGGSAVTVVRLDADGVLIVRGAEADLARALEFSLRR